MLTDKTSYIRWLNLKSDKVFNVFNYIIATFRLVLAMATMLVYFLFFKCTAPFKHDKLLWGIHIQKRYACLALFIFGTKRTVVGHSISEPALYVINHRSLLDPVLVLPSITALGVAKGEIEKYPILGSSVRGTGIIFVHRHDKDSRSKTKDAIVAHLKKGYSVFLFPEGTVSDELTTIPFKRGSFEKAVEASVPVVPIAIKYNNSKFHWFNKSTLTYYFQSFGWNTPSAEIFIGPPLRDTNATLLMEKSKNWIDGRLMETKSPILS